ncbi:putative starch synthase 4, chloroplastic/amyloplastic isoform X1 [Bidens hawaiensis]|uniref:putative starch synthase 4, chloroplastic/amyloplastic isoform X1 n=3 Tax=Bidens hawaiensis TaxID=980011 RepID=UPI00404B74BC
MEALLRSTLAQFTTTSKWKPRPLCCFGLENHNSIELNQSKNDIWRLFTEAQRNILYLNRQRVQALQQLDETKREYKSLLEKVNQMGSQSQTHDFITQDPFSISSDLLLRIDSMVLTGILDTREASGFRSLVISTTLNVADYFTDISKSDAEILAQLRHLSSKTKMRGFHIIHICTEMEPVASVGSLASYVTSLSHVLQKHGNLVEVILPMYATLNLEKIKSLREVKAEFSSYFDGKFHRNKIWTGVVNGIGATFIQPIYYSSFFDNEKIYGYPNDFERFSYFSRASLDCILKSGKQPDVIHIHNWETSIVGPLFWDIFVNQGLAATRIMLTCQSFKSQCLEKPDKLALCGLDPAKLHRHDRFQDNNKPHLVNILKAGIVYSNKVITMSSIHSKDQIVSTLSHGLETALDTHKNKLLIAPFGYEDSSWDPSHDKFLPRGYTADDMRGKSVSKLALQQQLGLPENIASVLIGYMFTEDSDADLENLKSLVWDSSRRDAQFIFVGINKKNKLDSFQEDLKDENVRFVDEYDESLLHLMFAGSDIILCSSDDPMLQILIKAIKYGTVPAPVNVADDRLRNYLDLDNTQLTRFSEYIINTFAYVPLNQAIDEIKKKPSQWNRKVLEAMSKDVSWDA